MPVVAMMETELAEQHCKVVKWLTELLGESPSFEVNETTVSVLHSMMQKSQVATTRCQLLCSDAEQRKSEYASEAKRLASTLNRIGVSTDVLDSPASTALDSLVSLADSMELSDVRWPSYCLGLGQLSQAVEDSDYADFEVRREQDGVLARTKQALVQVNTLKQLYGTLAKESAAGAESAEQSLQDIAFCQAKARQYQEQAKEVKVSLCDAGFQPDLEHQKLVQQSAELEQRKSLLQPLKAKLTSFYNLPADVHMASVKLEQLRQEVASLEQQLLSSINLMNT